MINSVPGGDVDDSGDCGGSIRAVCGEGQLVAPRWSAMAAMMSYTPDQIASLIAEKRLVVHFQPIVDLHDGLIVAYEALTRTPKDAGITDLAGLFHSAERHGLIWELEEVTRGNSIRTAAEWPRGTRLFLNCTPSVFADPRFLGALMRDLAATPDLSPERIVLEITELSEDLDVNTVVEQVRHVVAAGFQVALDDAGAGSSGLNRMMLLRPQWVKLDREFVSGIDRDTLRQNLVRFFVHYARMSGVQVLAEGIESATELQTVTSLGVRFAQGFYLGRPGSKEHTTDPRYLAELRSRWARVEASLPEETNEPTLLALCRPTAMHAAETRVRDIPDGTGDGLGIIVTDDDRMVGWCSPTAVRDAAGSSSGATLREVMSTSVIGLPGQARLQESLGEVIRHESDSLPDPIIVTTDHRPIGIVRLRDVLRIAATEGRLMSSGRASVTGLPGRAKADQHMTEQFARWRDPDADVSTLHADAAFIDIRAFSDYNNRRGSGHGDQLVRDLAELISAVVLSSLPEAFLAHLGDDRFLITAPAGRLMPRVRTLLQVFDDQYAKDEAAADRPVLLALCIHEALSSATHCRDIYRLEQRLRERARADAATRHQGPPCSALVSHVATAETRPRLAA